MVGNAFDPYCSDEFIFTCGNYFPRESIGRAPVRYGLNFASPIKEETLNVLLQRGVEHGFIGFFERMEAFYKKLDTNSTEEDTTSQSAAITMENIWIFVYIFGAANSFGTLIFLWELSIFHHEKIRHAIIRTFNATRRVIAPHWRKLMMNVEAMFVSIPNASRGLSIWLTAKLHSFQNALNGLWIRFHEFIH